MHDSVCNASRELEKLRTSYIGQIYAVIKIMVTIIIILQCNRRVLLLNSTAIIAIPFQVMASMPLVEDHEINKKGKK